MIVDTLGSENIIAQRLEQLAELYRQDQASELMERTLSKLFQYEADISRQQLHRLNDDLSGSSSNMACRVLSFMSSIKTERLTIAWIMLSGLRCSRWRSV